MNDAGLYETTVPVFRHYLERIDALISRLTVAQEGLLLERLAPNAFSAAEHLQCASGFVLRGVCPLLGRVVPEFNSEDASRRESLLLAVREVESIAMSWTKSDFDGAADRTICHSAGEVELRQDATSYILLFAVPNFFFHMATGFAILRHGGVEIGKADFDGQHVYAEGFHFNPWLMMAMSGKVV